MREADVFRTRRARELRRVDNDAERAFWSEVRGRRLSGYKFVRQEPIDRYFADFACREMKLVVELDGSQHVNSAHDVRRDRVMTELGWNVLRFWSVDVLKERDAVLETLLSFLDRPSRHIVEASDVKYFPAFCFHDL
jgi:very-short-patch-repair endonuclease